MGNRTMSERSVVRCVIALGLAILAGCATSSHVITGTPRPAIDPAEVKVYSTAPPQYDEIALIEASSRSSFSFGDQKKMETVIRRLKEQAAKLGANGVLLKGSRSESSGGVGVGVGNSVGGGGFVSLGTSSYSSQTVSQALAIYVPPDSEAAPRQ
jgi:hypothetical protein